MKTIRPGWIVAFFLCAQLAAFAQAAPQQAHAKKTSETAASFAFEPLDNWKAAVLAGDKAALTSYYTTSPPARTKTPKAETLDPSEEPTFWSSLKPAGLDHLDVKVLEAKTPQPGVMSLVLRIEAEIKTSAGENSSVISAAQVWVQKLGEWKIIATQRGDLAAKEARRRKRRKRKFPRRSPRRPRITSASFWYSAETGVTTATSSMPRFARNPSPRS